MWSALIDVSFKNLTVGISGKAVQAGMKTLTEVLNARTKNEMEKYE
jgi:hypothetical protein